jgi:hypothetical protein
MNKNLIELNYLRCSLSRPIKNSIVLMVIMVFIAVTTAAVVVVVVPPKKGIYTTFKRKFLYLLEFSVAPEELRHISHHSGHWT